MIVTPLRDYATATTSRCSLERDAMRMVLDTKCELRNPRFAQVCCQWQRDRDDGVFARAPASSTLLCVGWNVGQLNSWCGAFPDRAGVEELVAAGSLLSPDASHEHSVSVAWPYSLVNSVTIPVCAGWHRCGLITHQLAIETHDIYSIYRTH